MAIVAGLAGGCQPRAATGSHPVTSPTTAAPDPVAVAPAAEGAPRVEPPASPESYAGDEAPADEAESDAEVASASPSPSGAARPHPLDGWTDAQIAAALRDDPAKLGSISIGSPNAGRLWGGVQLPLGEAWFLVDPAHAHGTAETVAAIVACIAAVREEFPDTPPLSVGHLSGPRGGPLAPHLSHQSGRDVDVGYYYLGQQRWFARATAANLDRERTWAFVRALIAETDVEMILIDSSLQHLLRAHALALGEDTAWVESVFRGGGGLPPLIRHAKGHATHLHVRFFSPQARETARRAYPALVAAGVVEPPMAYALHRARPGDTLGKLAKKYGTTVPAIQRANGLRSTLIVARRTYRIPQPNAPVPASKPVVVPPRRSPPRPASAASVDVSHAAPRPLVAQPSAG